MRGSSCFILYVFMFHSSSARTAPSTVTTASTRVNLMNAGVDGSPVEYFGMPIIPYSR